jgi:hypothetical protein
MQHFRRVFQIVDKEKIHWFPGHMGKGLKQMQQKLKTVDCVIEVHVSVIEMKFLGLFTNCFCFHNYFRIAGYLYQAGTKISNIQSVA